MKKKVAEAWVADLRTNPPQCKGRLYNGKGHCCLGRLALLLGATFSNKNSPNYYYPVVDGSKDPINGSVLPYTLMSKAGMRTSKGMLSENDCLSQMNDDGATFAEIADTIEKNWEAL